MWHLGPLPPSGDLLVEAEATAEAESEGLAALFFHRTYRMSACRSLAAPNLRQDTIPHHVHSSATRQQGGYGFHNIFESRWLQELDLQGQSIKTAWPISARNMSRPDVSTRKLQHQSASLRKIRTDIKVVRPTYAQVFPVIPFQSFYTKRAMTSVQASSTHLPSHSSKSPSIDKQIP